MFVANETQQPYNLYLYYRIEEENTTKNRDHITINKSLMDRYLLKFSFAAVLFLFIFLIGVTFFNHPIYIWDEAIYANNALEMSRTQHPFVLTLDGIPNLYNTKPPLAIWLMAISIKLFGANEFAIRLPGVLAFLGVMILVLRFSKRQLASYYPGIVACLVLLGSQGLLLIHGVRSGDPDSLLLFCTTALVLTSIDLFLEEKKEGSYTRKKLLQTGVILLAGFFIKSTAIFILVPGLVICLLISGKTKSLFKERLFYFIPVILVAVIFFYYLLMHNLFPGYNSQVFFSEYKRVFKDIMPWHKESIGWYLDNMIKQRFVPFLYFLPPLCILGLISVNKNVHKITLYLLITSLVYLVMISVVPDKLEWYDLPVYPLLALIGGMGTYEIIQRLSGRFPDQKYVFWMIAVIIFCLPPFLLRKKMTGDNINDLEREAYCLREIGRGATAIHQLTVLMPVENPLHRLSAEFYEKTLNKRLEIRFTGFLSEIHGGDTVLCSQADKLDSLRNYFKEISMIREFKYGKLVVIN
ncbi:MAG: glycosyltransferase family 39 protein [Bacteroidota bacterium]|nr:glycosyltransferase family 39 protein [Bacteroidota bacterium]